MSNNKKKTVAEAARQLRYIDNLNKRYRSLIKQLKQGDHSLDLFTIKKEAISLEFALGELVEKYNYPHFIPEGAVLFQISDPISPALDRSQIRRINQIMGEYE
jgi:hypothetical protein